MLPISRCFFAIFGFCLLDLAAAFWTSIVIPQVAPGHTFVGIARGALTSIQSIRLSRFMVGHAGPASRRTAMGGLLSFHVLGILTYRIHCFLSSPITLLFLLLLCYLPSSPFSFLPFASLPHLSSFLVDYFVKFPSLFRLRNHAFHNSSRRVLRVSSIPSQSKFFSQLRFFCSSSQFPVCIP